MGNYLRNFKAIAVLIFILLSNYQSKANDTCVVVNIPVIILKNIPINIDFICSNKDFNGEIPLKINDHNRKIKFDKGKASIEIEFSEKCTVESKFLSEVRHINPIPLWLSILPPLIAIFMALLIKEVVSSLVVGIFVGAFIIYGYGYGLFKGLLIGLMAIVDTYVLESLLDQGHISIIVFSMLIGGMVGIITNNGGMKGVVNKLVRYANSPRSGQLTTWFLGIVIFFDDYANTLVVGNTMRPVADKLRISRQKLAYIVDSTAAPIASIAFITTWIGAELSYIESGIETLGLNLSSYNIFLNSLAYSFYPLMTIAFMLMLIMHKVDFGPMHKAEIIARAGNCLEIIDSEPKNKMQKPQLEVGVISKWYNAVIPVLIVVFGTIAGLVYTGLRSSDFAGVENTFFTKLSIIIGNSDSYKALLWSSMFATLIAIVMSISQKILSIKQCVESMVHGFKTMLPAIVILVLAWSLALLTKHLHTADFISQLMVEAKLSPIFVPFITFILAALVSFSTGSSWGTMAILYPLILPASWLITTKFGYEQHQSLNIFHNVVASVLAGSVLGDHCSPISDTTILSSLASSCSHIEHVRTQMPYAITVGMVALFIGVLPAAIGIPCWILFTIGFVVLYLIVKYFGKPTDR